MLNWVRRLPGEKVPIVRIRHLIVAPRLDFGAEDPKLYAQVLIGAVNGILTVSKEFYKALDLRFLLRSPEDVNLFAALGGAMAKSPAFETVVTRGAWLYVTLSKKDADNVA